MKRRAPSFLLLAAVLAPAAAAPLVVVRDVDPDAADARTREAFRAVFGRAGSALLTRDGRDFDFHPIATVDLGEGRIALLSSGAVREAGHSENGLNAIHYLGREAGRLRVVGTWFGIGAGARTGGRPMRGA